MASKVTPGGGRGRLTHFGRDGKPRMVDVSAKAPTLRQATAEAEVALSPTTLEAVVARTNAKGDVMSVAELAGVMAGKRTSQLIPLCHPIALSDLVVRVVPDREAGVIRIQADAATTAPTGVEMEALTAVSVAALTVYDMVKGMERGVTIREIRLLAKSGGRSGEWRRDAAPAAQPEVVPPPEGEAQ